MAINGTPGWMQAITIVAFGAWLVILLLPGSIVPPDRIPIISGLLTTIWGTTLGNEVFHRSKRDDS